MIGDMPMPIYWRIRLRIGDTQNSDMLFTEKRSVFIQRSRSLFLFSNSLNKEGLELSCVHTTMPSFAVQNQRRNQSTYCGKRHP